MPLDILDIAVRLGVATLVGVLLGLNRDLHGKSTGVRTLGLVCLGSALAVLSIHAATDTEESRVIQGIVTGVGFLGAGVIVRSEKGHHVHGLTTAACVWVTACVGAACAIAQWQIVVIGVVLVLILLVFGGPFERAIDRRWPGRPSGPSDQPPDRTLRLARRCREIFLLIWGSTASGVRPRRALRDISWLSILINHSVEQVEPFNQRCHASKPG